MYTWSVPVLMISLVLNIRFLESFVPLESRLRLMAGFFDQTVGAWSAPVASSSRCARPCVCVQSELVKSC